MYLTGPKVTQGIYRLFLGTKSVMHNYQDFAISAVHDFQEKQLNKRRVILEF